MMRRILEENRLIILEAAIVEQLRRKKNITLDPELVNAPLIYDTNGKHELSLLYRGYIEIALSKALPFILCTPTWRANHERVSRTKAPPEINSDAIEFMREIRDSYGQASKTIMIGGLMGCKNDCYLPGEGLTASEAEKFHAWQIHQLSDKGVDFLMAETLPNVQEALGIARAMAITQTPYIISFVISRNGLILDGTSLLEASRIIDEGTQRPPIGYMINCSYPTFLQAETQPEEFMKRLIGFEANGSSLDQSDLDGAEQLRSDDVSEWGDEMLKLNRDFGVKILGGCCGTGPAHLEYIVRNWTG